MPAGIATLRQDPAVWRRNSAKPAPSCLWDPGVIAKCISVGAADRSHGGRRGFAERREGLPPQQSKCALFAAYYNTIEYSKKEV